MKLDIIDTGRFYADGGAMFGAIPKTSWSKRYPSNESNGCVLSMRSVLLRTTCGRNVLIDTGAGDKQLKLLGYYHFFGMKDLKDELCAKGVAPEEITDVVLTHLHFDHCGYVTVVDQTTQTLRLSFPNARHWVSEAQWNAFLHPHPLEKDSFRRENMDLAFEQGLIRRIKKETELCPEVMLRLYDGHTKGQIVPYIQKNNMMYVFAGDVIPLAASVSPTWISAYDTCPLQSYNEKMRMLEQAAKEKEVLFFCHDAYTVCATVRKIGSFFKVDEVIDLEKLGISYVG
ncbi:MAG: MBL fold metallo-hydrolase [Massilibacteroides sp.]|nr:MBL fold metallo-hydrolase [Massilibacteroides sp.]MDD3062640.1 MBL fold metallo-hydrolase [Massilibacteroides sp.]MDD4116033.1 MBL fold metallo-hydrolase [Massilibacteroides sp.]MDD4659531.1 MBL fold metallo-hydrolase [Massilibacteroides sp.]